VSSSPTDAGRLQSVVMPQMGVSISEGTILEWRKRPGDPVEADETIADVSTDKIDVEIPSPAAGRLARIVAQAGDTVAVGEPIAEIETGGDGQRNGDGPHGGPGIDRSGFYSPVVRRIADQHDIDLDRVEGTGIGGRVRKRDVLAWLGDGEPQGGSALHSDSPYRAEPEVAPPGPSRPAEPIEPPAPAEPVAAAAADRREQMSPMRKLIARHMVESRRAAAHCTTIVEVDMSRVAARRGELKPAMARRGVPLTYLAFVARAAVAALASHPVLNASVEGEELVYHEDVNLGIAVALDGGLIVPRIPRAQRLSLEGMAAAIADLAERARSGRLEPDEVHGTTFTITNPGQFGAVLATPIINQPQVAILDLEAIIKRPVVVEVSAGDSIAIRPMTYLPMSWDHRALDGAEAARFLSEVKSRLETWAGE
jgi:pyruvate/2-oxoglutarate dehydrogenase complex dihydrolipoamide acyltransferase (E2) component